MLVGLVQQSFLDSKKHTMQFSAEQIFHLAKNGAKLVCLQELHCTEYFCQSEDTRFFDYANEYEADVAYFANIAKQAGVVLVGSFFEKRTAGMYHNTAVVFEKNGEIAGKYRKMHIPDDPQFYEKFYFTPGDLGFNPIATSVGRLGVLVCWDQWFPEAARIMALKRADMLIYPTAIGWFDEDSDEEKQRQRESWIAVMRGHSVANGLPTLAINRVGFEKDLSADSKDTRGIRFWGSSFAFGAQGELLAKANEEPQNLLVEVDLERSEQVRRIWPFLRDRRIENYTEILARLCD